MRSFRIILCLLFGVAFWGSPVLAQSKRQYLKAAEEATAKKDYYSALVYYRTVADAWPEDLDVAFQAAEAARHYNSYSLAEKYYERVLRLDKSSKYPVTGYHLAGVKRSLGRYREAIDQYRKYDEIRPDKPANSQKDIAACEFALEAAASRSPLEVVPHAANTSFSEFAPVIMGDTLIYTSLSVPAKDEPSGDSIYVSRLYRGDLRSAGQMTQPAAEGALHTAHAAMDPDRGRIYFSICRNTNVTDYQCGLYMAERDAYGWGPPQRLPDAINKPGYSTSQPALAKMPDGKEWLVFVSDAPGGKGGTDIWYTLIDQAGTFSDPVNLVSINTEMDEASPFYHEVSQRLFFSSNGYPSLGGFDIYETTYSRGRWSDPRILPIPLNSSYNDLYFSMDPRGEKLFLSSNRITPGAKFIAPELQACCNDIFMASDASALKLIANVFSLPDSIPLTGATVVLERQDQGVWVELDRRDAASLHSHEFPIGYGQTYRLTATRSSYRSSVLEFRTLDWLEPNPVVKDLYLGRELMEIDVLTFDAQTRDPLLSCKVSLVDVTDPAAPRLVDESVRIDNHVFPFRLKPGRKYEFRATRGGYEDAIATLVTNPDSMPSRIDLYLDFRSLERYLPLEVYFDNDIPTRKQRTKKGLVLSYDATLTPYLEKEQEYEQIFASEMTDNEATLIRREIREFFESQVRAGRDELDHFCEAMLRELKKGNSVEVYVEGFTSPRAESRYNMSLGYRRGSSVKTHFGKYGGGALAGYLASGQLRVKVVSYGETKVPKGVSDDLADKRLSVYAVNAARERRAEINQVKITKK